MVCGAWFHRIHLFDLGFDRLRYIFFNSVYLKRLDIKVRKLISLCVDWFCWLWSHQLSSDLILAVLQCSASQLRNGVIPFTHNQLPLWLICKYTNDRQLCSRHKPYIDLCLCHGNGSNWCSINTRRWEKQKPVSTLIVSRNNWSHHSVADALILRPAQY